MLSAWVCMSTRLLRFLSTVVDGSMIINVDATLACLLGADLLPSSVPECRFPSAYHGEWYHFESDRSEKVTITSEHITFAVLGEFVCKSKHWSINYYKLFSVYVNGWCVCVDVSLFTVENQRAVADRQGG